MKLQTIKRYELGDAAISFLRSVASSEGDDAVSSEDVFKVNGFSIQTRGEITQRRKIHFFIIADEDLNPSEIASDIAESLILSENQWAKDNNVENQDPAGFNVGGYSNRRPRIELRLFDSYTQQYMPPTILDHPNDIPGKEEIVRGMIELNKNKTK